MVGRVSDFREIAVWGFKDFAFRSVVNRRASIYRRAGIEAPPGDGKSYKWRQVFHL